MSWRVSKKFVDQCSVGVFDLRLNTDTGKGEIMPGPFYSSLEVDSGDVDEMRRQAIKKGYAKVREWHDRYVASALEYGVELNTHG